MNESNGNGDSPVVSEERLADRLKYLTENVDMAERLESLIFNSEITTNAFLSRISWWNRVLDPQRNIAKECGYPEGPIPIDSYKLMYDRDAISARVVEVLPMESWQVTPSIYEDEDSERVYERRPNHLFRYRRMGDDL